MLPNRIRNQMPTGNVQHPVVPGNSPLSLGNAGMPIMPGAPAANGMNVVNNLLPHQHNNFFSMQQLGQFPMGISVQNGFPGFNNAPGQFGNLLMPDMNQIKMAMQNLQFLPNVMQNLNQLLLMQTATLRQVPQNGLLAPTHPNPSQNPFFSGNPQYDLAHQILQNQQQLNPYSSQQWPPENGPPPANAHSSQPMRLQENPGSRAGTSPSKTTFRGYNVKGLSRNTGGEPSHRGVQRSHFHRNNHGKRKFESNGDRGQGTRSKLAVKFGQHNSTNPVKEQRSLYSEEEVHKWCEERRKNYPSVANIKKKLADQSACETEVKTRREELKKILAKQAELGCEVAEIPSHYLSGTEGKGQSTKTNSGPLTKNMSFEKRDRRGRRNKRSRFKKKPRLENTDSSHGSSVKKSGTSLLHKLLSKDIKKEKSRLLQVFRFMTMNSFFERPQESLKFPVVVVDEDGQEPEVSGEKCSVPPKDGSPIGNGTSAENLCCEEESKDGGIKEEEGEITE